MKIDINTKSIFSWIVIIISFPLAILIMIAIAAFNTGAVLSKYLYEQKK